MGDEPAALIANALAAWTASAKPSRSDARNRAALSADVHIEGDWPPRCENGAIAPCQRVIAGLHRSGQHFGDCDRRDRELPSTRGVRFKKRSESRGELWMILENVNDRRRIDEEKGDRSGRSSTLATPFVAQRAEWSAARFCPRASRPDSHGSQGLALAAYSHRWYECGDWRPCFVMTATDRPPPPRGVRKLTRTASAPLWITPDLDIGSSRTARRRRVRPISYLASDLDRAQAGAPAPIAAPRAIG